MAVDRKVIEPPEEALEAKAPPQKTSGVGTKERIRTPYWPKWKCYQFDKLYLAEAVALSCNIEPDFLKEASQDCFYDDDFGEFDLRFDIAKDVAGEAFEAKRVPEKNGLETIRVHLGDFVIWALKMQKLSPDIWLVMPAEFVAFAAERPAPKWPWGDHNTELLKHLAAAGELWEDYRRKARETAPRSKEVTNVLRARKYKDETFPLRVAQVMAQILRADDVKRGRRKK
jgi:hypothetical protein